MSSSRVPFTRTTSSVLSTRLLLSPHALLSSFVFSFPPFSLLSNFSIPSQLFFFSLTRFESSSSTIPDEPFTGVLNDIVYRFGRREVT
ncbi:unnamed protein product [Microthlaspi erraticum]|uniref:Uncharacterized protein n=1 Tax=Microthlaspi erraticum TaxID=1685480 RepID=A0A6D2IL17_9BRAS|nr:unnamed protein product [Microthlaspi erraticum]